MKDEPNVVKVPSNCVVIGDVHGQFFDLCKLVETFDKFQKPNRTPSKQPSYLFLGDYVDRGEYGVEVLIFLYAFKLAYPKKVYLLRGNHEDRAVNQTYSFRKECLEKYDE